MGKALYRKYRSKRLDEVVGQSHITATLSNALQSGKISHAYLFTGPHGVGKTSVARILAHEVNQFPYTDEAGTYMDIIEIDAASNRRIDEIRDLRDHIHSAPTAGKYKVYIIDEVHMLTKEAFNALLKTLEEPPQHVVFILATTEPHKLPETIISRTQRFSFRPISQQDAKRHLQYLAKQESVDITDDALELIVQSGNGSFRDAISLLDQLASTSTSINAEQVRDTLGIIPSEAIARLADSLESGTDTASLVEQLSDLRHQGFQAPQIAQQLLHYLRPQLVQSASSDMRTLMSALIQIPLARDPAIALELLLVGHVLGDQNKPQQQPTPAKEPAATAAKPPAQPTEPQSTSPKSTKKPAAAKETASSTTASDEAAQPANSTQTAGTPDDSKAPAAENPTAATHADIWPQTLEQLRTSHNTLYGIARMARTDIGAGTLTLFFRFPFHKKRMNEPKNKQILMDIMQRVSGQPWNVDCQVAKDQAQSPAPSPAAAPASPAPSNATPDPTLQNISSVFGGAEVLDS
ncbi:DNA polymerase III, subunit gamma and tau [Candidatus Saccharibacteria bacterium]|nr:MAG: DNA polymerase III, subunit gamma and tau [Candidatus Saccharibacteria bacterium]